MKETILLKQESYDKPAKRRQDSNLWDQMFYGYFNEILRRGSRKDLEINDFALIEDADKGADMARDITNEWKAMESPSLLSVLIKVYGKRYAVAGIVFFLEFWVQLSQGYFLARLLEWIGDPNGEKNLGYYYAAGISLDAFLYGVFHHWEWFITIRTGMQVRVGLIATIYQKCLNLSLANTSSTGFIINLVSNDVQRFEDLAMFLHYSWIGVLQVIGYMTLIYFEIGYSVFAAVFAILMLLPMQGTFGAYFKKYRELCVAFRDDRIKSISDMVLGIFVVKLYAWEVPFIRKVMDLRKLEMVWIWSGNLLKAINDSVFFSSGVLVNGITFTTYYLAGGVLTPSKVFSTIVYLNVLKLCLTNFIPKVLQLSNECIVSIRRIESFLSLPDVKLMKEKLKDEVIESDTAISIKNASFAWEESGDNKKAPILIDINLDIKKGGLYVIAGVVGSGKSSLLQAILNDMILVKGSIDLNTDKIAYVSQSAWILSGSIKDNILFGGEYDKDRFLNAIQACALDKDLDQLPNGVDTFIGERGVTLSGGQRARLSLCRAVYSNADLYLLDDCLSAVDTKVGRHLFEKCIMGTLKTKTVVLVTHQIQFLSKVDQIVVLENGRIVQNGNFEEISASQSSFSQTIREFNQQAKVEESQIDEITDPENSDDIALMLQESEAKKATFSKEEVVKGGVSFSTYYNYFKVVGSWQTIVMIIAVLIPQVTSVMTDFWLSSWSSQSSIAQENPKYAIVFVVLATVTIIFTTFRAVIFYWISWIASKVSFEKMLKAVFRSPMSFFHNNPHGRTINRFSKDINLMDETLPQVFFDLVQCSVLTLGILAVSVIVVPYLLIVYPFIAYMFLQLRNYYMKTTRQVKRIEAITRSPVYSAIPSTLEGLSTIRAFSAKERFLKEFFFNQDENTRMFFAFVSSSRWLGLRLDLLTALLITVIIFIAIPLRDNLGLTPSLIGLLISYLIQATGTLQWAVRQFSEVENLMVSVERVFEFTQLPSERPAKTDLEPPQNWPDAGKIEVKNMSLKYPSSNPNENGNLVLKNISISINPGEKVGIVGRTGAGKSSFLQALFRMVEPIPEKSISIDDIFTSELGLDDLRSRISIIPQEPFCFKGTLRFNLDPFGKYSDDDLWRALEAVELKTSVEAIPEKLEAEVSENGSNWSVGERQLICLGRAILKNTKLIVMDEATSSVDLQTDQMILKSTKTLFSNATVLTIAHRLLTVIEYDKILVLEKGEVVEFGSPKDLLSKPVSQIDAWFARMVKEMGPEAEANLKAIAGLNF